MNEPSSFSTAAFTLLVAAVACAFVAGVTLAGRRWKEGLLRTTRWAATAVLLVLGWLALTGVLGMSGMLAHFERTPPPLLLVTAAATLMTAAFAFSPIGTRLVRGLTPFGLVGFQVFRVPLEALLFRLHAEGVVPEQMTFAGLNFDVLSGLLAIPVALRALRGRLSLRALVAWNILALALLLIIVTVAVLSAPVPFRVFHNEPANTFVTTFPFVWLPLFLVQAAWFGHLLVFRYARAMSRPAHAARSA